MEGRSTLTDFLVLLDVGIIALCSSWTGLKLKSTVLALLFVPADALICWSPISASLVVSRGTKTVTQTQEKARILSSVIAAYRLFLWCLLGKLLSKVLCQDFDSTRRRFSLSPLM